MKKNIINKVQSKTKQKKGKGTPTIIRGCFDGIANKFDKNIYGTSKGKLRHQLLVHHLSGYIDQGLLEDEAKENKTAQYKRVMDVLDVGGGTGMMALEFAREGHNVHLTDISQDVLDVASQRLRDFANTSVELVSIDDVRGQYDFIVCHALLEWLDQPLKALAILMAHLTEGGVMSLSFFNQDAKVFSNLLYGNFDYVNAGLPKRNTVRLNPHNAQTPRQVIDFINRREDTEILATNGIRCIHDYILDKTRIEPQYGTLFELELRYGALEPYKCLGKYFHILLKKKHKAAITD